MICPRRLVDRARFSASSAFGWGPTNGVAVGWARHRRRVQAMSLSAILAPCGICVCAHVYPGGPSAVLGSVCPSSILDLERLKRGRSAWRPRAHVGRSSWSTAQFPLLMRERFAAGRDRVQVVFENGDATRELDLDITRPGARVADLLAALGADKTAEGVLIDGRFVDGEALLGESGLFVGATVAIAGRESPSLAGDSAESTAEICQVAGLDAGRCFRMPEGRCTVGRDDSRDVVLQDDSVSRAHFELECADGVVAVRDLGSSFGTFVDGKHLASQVEVEVGSIIQAGDVAFRVRCGLGEDRPLAVDPRIYSGPAGTIPFNRPPRAAAEPPLPPLIDSCRPRRGDKSAV